MRTVKALHHCIECIHEFQCSFVADSFIFIWIIESLNLTPSLELLLDAELELRFLTAAISHHVANFMSSLNFIFLCFLDTTSTSTFKMFMLKCLKGDSNLGDYDQGDFSKTYHTEPLGWVEVSCLKKSIFRFLCVFVLLRNCFHGDKPQMFLVKIFIPVASRQI